jgi:hypothetical protein
MSNRRVESRLLDRKPASIAFLLGMFVVACFAIALSVFVLKFSDLDFASEGNSIGISSEPR